MQLSHPVHWRRGQRKEQKKIRHSTVLVEVYTSELSTAKIEQAFLLEGEKIDGSSETVGIQWLTTDYQEYVPLARVVRGVIGGRGKVNGEASTTTSKPAAVPDVWPTLHKMHRENPWWSESNELKHCVQGCITNLLHHMRAVEAAKRFQRLSTMDDATLMLELGIKGFPSKVSKSNSQVTDDFEKCKWLLRDTFKCQHTKPINVTEFSSLDALVDNMSRIKFPVIVSMKTTNSSYNHVICIWNNAIIDYENQSTYPLTINNLDFSCGPMSSFIAVNRGYGIFPSKEMRRACREMDGIVDWGESDVKDELRFLFKSGRFQ